MSKWFLQYQGYVQGPFSNESMQSALAQVPESHIEKALFWKRGLTEWMKATKWRADLTSPQNQVEQVTTTSVTISKKDSSSKNMTETNFENILYRVQFNFIDQPLMNKNELMAFISRQQDASKISIQNLKTKEWNDVYAYPDIVERLGISRRKNTRVPILANFIGSANKGTEFNVKVITISEGGMGFTEVFDLKIGDQVDGQLISPHFFQPIHLQADVIYSGLDGYIGLKFSHINDESKSAIIEYVKKFGKSQNHP